MTCIDHSKLDQIPVTARIYSMINIHDSEEPDENEEILDRINGFHNLTLIAIKQAFSWFPRRYAEHKTDGRQAGVGKELEINEITMTTNLDQSCNVLSFLLDYQTSVLMLIKMQVILGLADSSLIKSAIECTGLVLKIDHEKIPNIEKSSILFFFKYCRRKPSLKQSFQKLIAQSLDLLQTLIAIRRHYQVISFLKLWSISEKLEKIDDSTWTEMIFEVFSIFSLTAENKNDQKLFNLNSMNKNFVQIVEDIFPEESGTRKASIVSGDLSFEVNPTDEIKRFRKDLKGILHQRMPVDLILVENLFKDQASNENVNYQPTYNARQDANFIQEKAFQIDFIMRICNTIMSNLDQAQQVFHILNMIVIFQGLYQKKIYRTLTFDTHSKHELINDKLNESVPLSEKDINSPSPEASPPEPIAAIETEPQNQISIHYLEKELLNLKRKRAILDPKDPGARLQIDQAQDEVQKIIIALADYLQESYKLKLQFTKTQNLMRNLGFGSVVISIIEDQNNHSLIPMCLKFLHYFSYMNIKNLEVLVPHLEQLLTKVLHHPTTGRLIANLVNSIEDKQIVVSHLKNIFNKVVLTISSEGVADYVHIGREKASKPQRKIATSIKKISQLIAFLKILSYCTVDDHGKSIKDNQLTLLGLLINNPEIARIYESQFFFSVRKLIQSKQQKQLSDADRQFIDFYLASLSLIADLGRYHTESKEQARRICEVHILQEYLISKKQLFLLKKEILKLYHFVEWS